MRRQVGVAPANPDDALIRAYGLVGGGTKTAAFTADIGLHYVLNFASGLGAVVITLPTTPVQGGKVAFTRIDGNDLTSIANVTPGGGDTIADINPWPMTQLNNIATFLYSGTTWYPDINWEIAAAADPITRALFR